MHFSYTDSVTLLSREHDAIIDLTATLRRRSFVI